jgi:hypothetical protein
MGWLYRWAARQQARSFPNSHNRPMPRLTLALVCAVAVPSSLCAQNATVRLMHPPKDGDKKPSVGYAYQLPGESENVWHAGLPELISVPQGGLACFRIEGANPLLYTYSVGSTIVKVETPDTVGQIIKQLLALAPKAALAGAGFVQPTADEGGPEPAVRYAQVVGQVLRLRTEAEALKISSDTATNILALARVGKQRADAATDSAGIAEDVYKGLTDATRKLLTTRVLRAAHLEQTEKAKRLSQEFMSVQSQLNQPLCSAKLDKDRLHVTLSIAAKAGIPADNITKYTGDEVAAFDVEPLSTKALDFGPGMVINALVRQAKTFSLVDQKIEEGQGDGLLFRPAVFANFRYWSPQWVWGTVGVSGNKDGIEDLFVGLTARFVYSVAGARLAMGIGLAATRLPSGLTQGVVGQPLPANVSELDKIIKKSLMPGVGVMINVMGF